MPFVSITRVRVSWRHLPMFLIHSAAAIVQAKFARGNLSVSILLDSHFAFWSRTVWSEEAATRAFMHSGVHRRVMPRLFGWCNEAAVAHWMADDARPPSWSEAHRRLQTAGRPSKVQFPSEAQQRFEIPPPWGRSTKR
jgi:hypothetical protein